ncbi:HAMP domain-containing sensor histidine kinase [Treponema sp.]|jgi:signal transduction histidine kinase|uniref:sensor histidine kinase n=1 Tax=Treponema sp. TaxID=166 RepID=UPI00257FC291|nr:HAMP domain-containing sensor histidine kinase [Treponema sp.]MBE6354161.1 HAMP domain-containing histidine kinase [Treponema sp.]
MKIKTQFRILILIIVIIPLTAVISLPVYHYLTSPERYLMKGYREVKKLGNLSMSENAWEEIKDAIKHVPPGIQILIYYDNTVITSSIPQIKSGQSITTEELFDFIHRTSAEYDYQIHEGRSTPGFSEKKGFRNVLIISRASIHKNKPKHLTKFVLPAIVFLILFEAGAIIVIWKVSRSVTSSISYVEEHTRKIADGNLDARLDENRLKKTNSNEITSLIKSLEKMRSSLKEDEERRVKFIMGISHDLRTPVALIKGYTEAITDGVAGEMDSESVKNSLKIIHDKSEVLEDMINDLIDYVKLNNTEWARNLVVTPLKPVITDILSSCCSTAELYNRKITSLIQVDEQIKIPMDKTLFERAIQNIFGNAVHYTKDGDSIELKAEQKDCCIEVSIKDSGCGIEEKDLEHIFDLFYRGTSSRREAGYGIGLSVVKTIIDSMNWNISVSSKIKEGTCFTISIPLNGNRIS